MNSDVVVVGFVRVHVSEWRARRPRHDLSIDGAMIGNNDSLPFLRPIDYACLCCTHVPDYSTGRIAAGMKMTIFTWCIYIFDTQTQFVRHAVHMFSVLMTVAILVLPNVVVSSGSRTPPTDLQTTSSINMTSPQTRQAPPPTRRTLSSMKLLARAMRSSNVMLPPGVVLPFVLQYHRRWHQDHYVFQSYGITCCRCLTFFLFVSQGDVRGVTEGR